MGIRQAYPILPLAIIAMLIASCSGGASPTLVESAVPPVPSQTPEPLPADTPRPTSTPASTNTPQPTGTPLPLVAACASEKEPILVDDFESGELANWRLYVMGRGSWYVYSDGRTPPNPAISDPSFPFRVPDPPQGEYAAVTDMDMPGTRIMFRDLKLDGPCRLQLTIFYVNKGGDLSSTNSFAFGPARENHQFRIDLLETSAPVKSLLADDVLATVFLTSSGDPSSLEPTLISFDLTPWEGRTVRLRLANTDNQGPLRVGVDDIYLVSVED